MSPALDPADGNPGGEVNSKRWLDGFTVEDRGLGPDGELSRQVSANHPRSVSGANAPERTTASPWTACEVPMEMTVNHNTVIKPDLNRA